MKTFLQLIADLKGRKGPSNGVTIDGRFWVVFSAQLQEEIDLHKYLDVKHYEDGTIKFHIVNYNPTDATELVMGCSKMAEFDYIINLVHHLKTAGNLQKKYEFDLVKKLKDIGMPYEAPGPDETGELVVGTRIKIVNRYGGFYGTVEKILPNNEFDIKMEMSNDNGTYRHNLNEFEVVN